MITSLLHIMSLSLDGIGVHYQTELLVIVFWTRYWIIWVTNWLSACCCNRPPPYFTNAWCCILLRAGEGKGITWSCTCLWILLQLNHHIWLVWFDALAWSAFVAKYSTAKFIGVMWTNIGWCCGSYWNKH